MEIAIFSVAAHARIQRAAADLMSQNGTFLAFFDRFGAIQGIKNPKC
ncbi:MAG: hypothetical protein HYX42_15150 [Polaromonas sp.]|nr:hypothetical protein [Polaromonas sp.]MBI2727576.1 hypothetical protein [Polaromonas sp.]